MVTDVAGWERAFRAEYPAMVRLAGLLVGDTAVGEDIAQEAFARLVEAGDRVDSPTAYLRAIVIKRSSSHIRRLVVARRRLPPVPTVVVSDEMADDLTGRSVVRVALMRLSRRQREAVVLRYFAGLNDAEVAQAMGVSAGTVKTHLHRARAALRDELEDLR